MTMKIFLLVIAKHGTASHMVQLVKKYQTVKRNCLTQDHEKTTVTLPEESRQMVSYQEDDGMWVIHAKLPAESGALVIKAIDAILQQEQQVQKEQEQVLSQEPQTTDLKNVSADTFSGVTSKPKQPSISKRKADALSLMAEHYLATLSNEEGIKTLKGNERCQVMLHVDINTLKDHNSHTAHQHCNLDNNQWISPETAQRLACDASLVTVLEDNKGKVLNIGRRSRTIPPSIQRALSLRDTTCRHPGCCSNHYLDAHHIKHWANGGETRLDNLVMLCRYHHRQLHQGAFSIENKQSELQFKTKTGKVIKQSFFPQFPEHNPECRLKKQWPAIDRQTAVSHWQGEKMDYGMAIDGIGVV